MNITIIGGGKVGYYLVQTLLPYNHNISLIERNFEACELIAEKFDILVINGDGTDINILEKANVDNTNTFISVTGKDEENLIACQLAKRNFGVNRTVARVNNPKNIEIFLNLGVDIPISSTSIIADHIEQEVDYKGIKTILKLRGKEIIISEIKITWGSPACDKTLMDISMPKECVITSIIRDKKVIIPNGQNKLLNGDFIMVVSSESKQKELADYFLGEKKK